MSYSSRPTEAQVTGLDGAVAELVHEDRVAGWVTVSVQPLRDAFLLQNSGCWILTTWADGTVEIEEDYDPFPLVAELLSGTVTYEDRDSTLRVRWVPEGSREGLWRDFGIHEPVGHYLALAARQRRTRRSSR